MAQPSSSMPPNSPGAVLLPCEPDQFRDFIAGLLGQPQTITRRLDGPFEVTRTDIKNIYHLLDQRLSSQNEATLVQFTVRTVYDDNSSVLLNSFADFQSYNEAKPLRSLAVHLSWTWLIQFRNKKFPEKQQIEISFTSNEGPDIEFASPRRVLLLDRSGSIRIRISHTDRTWGTDIDALLAGNLGLLQKPQVGLRKVADKYSGWIGLFVSIVVLGCALLASYSVTNSFVERYLTQARTLPAVSTANFEPVTKKVDFLIGIIASGMWTRYAVYVFGLFIVSLIIAIVCGIFVASYAENKRPSFVLLTPKAKVKDFTNAEVRK